MSREAEKEITLEIATQHEHHCKAMLKASTQLKEITSNYNRLSQETEVFFSKDAADSDRGESLIVETFHLQAEKERLEKELLEMANANSRVTEEILGNFKTNRDPKQKEWLRQNLLRMLLDEVLLLPENLVSNFLINREALLSLNPSGDFIAQISESCVSSSKKKLYAALSSPVLTDPSPNLIAALSSSDVLPDLFSDAPPEHSAKKSKLNAKIDTFFAEHSGEIFSSIPKMANFENEENLRIILDHLSTKLYSKEDLASLDANAIESIKKSIGGANQSSYIVLTNTIVLNCFGITLEEEVGVYEAVKGEYYIKGQYPANKRWMIEGSAGNEILSILLGVAEILDAKEIQVRLKKILNHTKTESQSQHLKSQTPLQSREVAFVLTGSYEEAMDTKKSLTDFFTGRAANSMLGMLIGSVHNSVSNSNFRLNPTSACLQKIYLIAQQSNSNFALADYSIFC